jgi:hypothetical protein
MDQLDEDISQLKSAGFWPIAKQYRDMATALRVISTWATFMDGRELVPKHTEKLCDKTLKRFRGTQ